MKFFQTKAVFVFFASIFFISACGASSVNSNNAAKADNATNANSDTTKDDIEDFAKIVKLPAQPEEVSWRETDEQGAKKMIAVLKFSAPDAQKIVAQAEKVKPAAPAELEAENWFPPELIAKSQESGDESLKGNAYAANDFFSETYKNGKLTRINDTDYFVLEMTSF